MVLLIILLLVAISFILLCILRNKEVLFIFLCCASLALFLLTVLMYIAKKGGFPSVMMEVFFLTKNTRVYLQYFLILLRDLGFIMAIGRFTFPLFLCMFANQNVSFLSRKVSVAIKTVATAVTGFFLIVYIQPVFVAITQREAWRQQLIMNASETWIISLVLISLLICMLELPRISIRLLRRRYLQKIAIVMGLACLYLIYCRQDPAQVYLFYHEDVMLSRGLWYLSPIMGLKMHVMVLSVLVCCSAVSIVYMMHMTVVELRKRKETHHVRMKFNIVQTSGNLFVHGIKNQLLAQQVVQRRMEQAIRDEHPSIPQMMEYLQESRQMTTDMLNHVNHLYQVFREKQLRLSYVSLESVLERVKRHVLRRYPEALISIEHKNDYRILADAQMLHEALLNIVTNGWEATLKAGQEKRPVTLRCYPSQSYIVIEITDRGIGIPKKNQQRIFEPLFTDKNTTQNWGMGLYYANTVINKHYGTLYVDSQVEKGSTFYVLLPLYRTMEQEEVKCV